MRDACRGRQMQGPLEQGARLRTCSCVSPAPLRKSSCTLSLSSLLASRNLISTSIACLVSLRPRAPPDREPAPPSRGSATDRRYADASAHLALTTIVVRREPDALGCAPWILGDAEALGLPQALLLLPLNALQLRVARVKRVSGSQRMQSEGKLIIVAAGRSPVPSPNPRAARLKSVLGLELDGSRRAMQHRALRRLMDGRGGGNWARRKTANDGVGRATAMRMRGRQILHAVLSARRCVVATNHPS